MGPKAHCNIEPLCQSWGTSSLGNSQLLKWAANKSAQTLSWRGTLSLLAWSGNKSALGLRGRDHLCTPRAVCYTDILGKIIQKKSCQCLCLKVGQKCKKKKKKKVGQKCKRPVETCPQCHCLYLAVCSDVPSLQVTWYHCCYFTFLYSACIVRPFKVAVLMLSIYPLTQQPLLHSHD